MPTTDSAEDIRLVENAGVRCSFSSKSLSSVATLSVPTVFDAVIENRAASMANTDCGKALSSPVEASPAKPSSTSPSSSDDSFGASPSASHISSAADSLQCVVESSVGKTEQETSSSVSLCPATPFGDTGETDYPNKLTFKGITVTLESSKIWNDFHKCGTEMILTKQGRHMFPYCRYRISGLDPERKYTMVLSVPPADALKYKWNGTSWEVSGQADHLSQGLIRAFSHHYSPCTGAEWMKVLVSFKKLKVTNNGSDQEGNIILHSLHRYIPRLHIVPVPDRVVPTADQPVVMGPESMTFTFPQTEFMAVTTYQNFRITQMKIRYNPFAKGFREDGNNPRLQRVSREIRYVSVETTGASATAQKEVHKEEQKKELKEEHSLKEKPKQAGPIILKPIMSPFSRDANVYVHCRGKCALGNLVVVRSQEEEQPKKEKSFAIDLTPPVKLCIAVNPKAKFSPSSSPKQHKYKKNWGFSSSSLAPGAPNATAVLDNVEGLLFVSFTTKAALDRHVVDQPVKTPDPSGSQSPTQFSKTIEREDKFVSLEAQLLKDLHLLKHRQTLHPVLQEVGLKLSSLDPFLPIDLQYLGVQLPLPPKITHVVAGDTGLAFISRTGKTSDVTKIKGWRNKFVKSDKVPQSDANHSDGSGSKNFSAFCSDMLDEYLESEERRISERAETFSSRPQSAVAYELPAKSSSYVRTLDSVLRQRAPPPPPPPASAPDASPCLHKPSDLNSEPLSPTSLTQSASPALSDSPVMLTMAQRLSKFLPEPAPNPASEPVPDPAPLTKATDLPKPQHRLSEVEHAVWNQGLKTTKLTQDRLQVALSALLTKWTQLNEVFRLPGYQRPPVAPCGREFCRLGCVCDSLYGHHRGAFRASFHCRRVECMFGCSCFKETIPKNLFTAMTEPDASSSGSQTSLLSLKSPSKNLWVKSVDDSDKDPVLIPETAKNLLPTVEPKPNPSPKTGSKTVNLQQPPPPTPPPPPPPPPPPQVTPTNQMRDEDKELLFKFLESKMSCARVREFNYKPPPEETLANISSAAAPVASPVITVTTPKTTLTAAATTTTTVPAPQASRTPEAPAPNTNSTNLTKPAEKKTEKPKSNVFVLKKKLGSVVTHDGMRPRTLIEIQSACKWANEDRKMVLEALCLNMNRNRLCRPFTVGPYYIQPVAKIVMQKPNECVITYKVRISLKTTGSHSDSDEEKQHEKEKEEKNKEKEKEKKKEEKEKEKNKQKEEEEMEEEEEGEISEESRADMTEAPCVVGPFLSGIQSAGVLKATTAQSSQCSPGLVQVNGKFYSHARLMLGRMGSLHPANRVAAFVTGRLGGTSNVYRKPSSPAPSPTSKPAPNPAPNPAPQTTAVPPTVLKRPLVPQMLSSFQLKSLHRQIRQVKTIQPDIGKPSQVDSMPPPPPPRPPSPALAQKTLTSPFHSASPISITVSPSLKTPSFLTQKGSYFFRICPPDSEACKLPGVSLPGGFTLIQLPKPAPDNIPNLDQNNANSLLSQMVNKALGNFNSRPKVIRDDSESGEPDSNSGSDFTDEDGEVDIDDELSVDVETVRETEEQIMVDRLRLAAGIGPNPHRRFVPRRYPLQMRSPGDDGSEYKRHEKKCSEQQRRDEQRELFDSLQHVLEPDIRTQTPKLHLLTMATREIKSLTERCNHLEDEKKLLTHIQKAYVQRISLMSSQSEETILEKFYDCEKQKQKEKMSSNSPYSDLLQSNADMVQAIGPQSGLKSGVETTPLLKPIKLEATEEPARPEPSEAQRKASEEIQATAKNFLQQLLTKLKPIIDNAKICHLVAKNNRPIQAKRWPPGQMPVEVSTSSAKNTTTTRPPTLALPLIRSKAGRIILPSSMKPAAQTYYTLTLAQNSGQRPTIFLKPLEPAAIPQQNILNTLSDGDNPTVVVQQPVPPIAQPAQLVNPDPPQSYAFKSPLPSIAYLNKTISNQAAALPTSPTSTTTTANTNLTPKSEARTNQTAENQPKTFPVVPNPVNNPKPFAAPPVKRGRGRPRKNPHPTAILSQEPKLVIKEDPDYAPAGLSPSTKRPAQATLSPRAVPAKRGRPAKSRTPHTLSPRVELQRCLNPHSVVKKEEEEWDIDVSNVHMNGSRPLTRGSLGKDFPSAKKRSWIDLESELDVDIE